MKNKQKILVIGDPHCNQNRKQAWDISVKSIFSNLKKQQFDTAIITGDLFDKAPTIEERIMFAEFLKKLNKVCKKIILIKGTDSHEFTKGFYNFEDLILLTDIEAYAELTIDDFIFGHYEVKGTRYINGRLSESKREVDEDKIYVLGHIHSAECSFDNVNYVSSMYKTSFAEVNDTKRIAIIEDNKINWLPIKSFPMYEIKLIGDSGKVKASGLKQLKESGDKYIDLKIKVETDSTTLGEIHRTISKIKNKYKIEYYKDDIKIKEIKTDIPEDLDETALLKNFCKQKKTSYKLIEKELK